MSDSETEASIRQALDPALPEMLRRFGYDIEAPREGETAGRSIVARRDRGDRVIVLAVDAAGRFRVDIAQVLAERAAQDAIAGAPVRLVETVTRALTIAGTITAWEQMAEFLEELEGFAAEARRPDREPPPSPTRDIPI